MTKKISVEELQEQYKQKLFDWCNEENNCCMESILTDGEEHSDTECFHGTKKCPCFECKRTKGLIDVMVDNICEMIYEVKSLDEMIEEEDKHLDISLDWVDDENSFLSDDELKEIGMI